MRKVGFRREKIQINWESPAAIVSMIFTGAGLLMGLLVIILSIIDTTTIKEDTSLILVPIILIGLGIINGIILLIGSYIFSR